jgi:hypothetical protein
MKITRETTIGALLSEHPEAEEILVWYDLELSELIPERRLGELCRRNRIDLAELIDDLVASLYGDEETDAILEDEGD